AVPGARERGRRALDLASVAHVDRAHLYPERRRHGLDDAVLSVPERIAGISKDCRSRHVWRDLLEQLQPFPAQTVFEEQEPGSVTAWSGKAIYKAAADRIDDTHKHDRHGTRRLLQCRQGRAASG